MFATFGFMREPFIFSIRRKRNLPPSRAGKGKKFITAKFTDIIAAKDKR